MTRFQGLRAILYRDLLYIWKQLLFGLLACDVIWAFFYLQASDQVAFYAGFVIAGYALWIPIDLIKAETAGEWNLLLPHTAWAMVLSKYLIGWLCLLLGLVSYLVIAQLSALLGLPSLESPSLLMDLGITLFFQSCCFPVLFLSGGQDNDQNNMLFLLLLVVGSIFSLWELSQFLPVSLSLALYEALPFLPFLIIVPSILLSVRLYQKRLP